MDILIFNPHAGKLIKEGITADQLLARLKAKDIHAHAPHDLTMDEIIAVAKSSGRLIVAGGDGTIHSILKKIPQCSGLRLGIIPGGTANHLAASLGIPYDVDSAIDIISAGHVKKIDLGKVDGTIFSQAAGVGLHAEAFHMYGERKVKSKLDAASTMLKVLTDWQPQLMRVILDGEPFVEELVQITAANTPQYGGVFIIAPYAKIDDGLLDVVMLGNLTKLEIIEYGYAAKRGTLTGLPKTFSTRAKKIEIASLLSEPIAVHADAQPAGFTPVTIEVMPGCVEVVVPEEPKS